MPGLKENLDCPRRMAVYAVFDVLDSLGARYEQELIGDIKAEVSVLGKVSEFALAVTGESLDTSILHLTMLRPADGLQEEEKALALRYLMDCVLWHVDEVKSEEAHLTG